VLVVIGHALRWRRFPSGGKREMGRQAGTVRGLAITHRPWSQTPPSKASAAGTKFRRPLRHSRLAFSAVCVWN
jgi:hypothetical protein